MNNFLGRSLRGILVINFSGKLRNFGEGKIGGASIVAIVFIAVSALGAWVLKVIGLLPDGLFAFRPSRQGWAKGAINALAMEFPVDGAEPGDGAQHPSHMHDDLPSSAYVMRISSQVRAACRG